MEERRINPQDVKGWGIDYNPEDEPNYPMKHYTGDDHNRLNYARPPLQVRNEEILQSNERPSLSAVFGDAVPPSGLSGMMRRKAFRYSENHYGHWMLLMAADRVNVVEGIIDDIKKGVFPNIYKEKGGRAIWKHNPKMAAKNTAISLAIFAGILLLLRGTKKLKSAS